MEGRSLKPTLKLFLVMLTSCKARDPKLEKYLKTVRRLEASFEGFSVKNIPRGENEHADLLAKSAAQGLPLPSEVFFETIRAPSVELLERAVLTISPVHSEDWRTEIISFLQGNCLSDDEIYNKNGSKNKTICHNRRGVIYTWSLFPTSQVLIQNRRYRTDEGDTCRILWIPYWVQTSSGKGFPTRILLAEGSFGRSRFGSKVRKLPKMCKRS
jgi:hypothetical protein